MKRRRKKDREMLSYEDKPIEEYERDESKKSSKSTLPKGKIKVIAGIIVVLVVIVAGFSLWKYIAPSALSGSVASSKAQGSGYPVEIVGKTVNEGDTGVLNNNLAYVSETQFQVVNSNGGLVVDERLKFTAPAMVCSGNYAIIYDKGGAGYQIATGSGIAYKDSVEDEIFTATINNNGDYAILSKKSGYTAKLTVFKKDHTQKYAYYFSECYAIDVSINSDLSKAVVCGLDASEGNIVSKIYVLDFTKEEPVAKIDFKGTTIYDISFMKNGNIAAVGDTSSLIITSDYQSKYEFTYNGYNLSSKKIVEDGVFLSLSPFEDGKSCEVWHITQKGITTTTKTGLSTDSMDVQGNCTAILSNNKITTFDTATQTTLKEYDAGIDAKNILFADEKTVYVVGTSEIRKVDLNQ